MSVITADARRRVKDIDGYYKLEIEPWLKKREQQRVAAVRRRWLLIGAGIVAAAAIAFYVWSTPGLGETWYLMAAGVAAVSLVLGMLSTSDLRQEVKAFLAGKLAAFYGFGYEAAPSRNPVPAFLELGLITGHDRCRIEDRWWGAADGVAFDLVEAHLEDRETERDSDGKTTTRTTTVFRGLLMTFAHHPPVAGSVILRRDLGRLGNWIRTKFAASAPVKIDEPEFEKTFEVFADDAAEARRLLTPHLCKRILGLAAERRLVLAFKGSEAMLAIEGKNLFELGSLGRTLLDPGRFRRMADELAIVFEVVEQLEPKPAAGGR